MSEAETLNRNLSVQTIAHFLTTNEDNLTKSETVTIAGIESPLILWIDRGRDSLVASFGNGVLKGIQAVRPAIVSPWPNRQTAWQITKLKLVKRQICRSRKAWSSSGPPDRRGMRELHKIYAEPTFRA